MNTTKLHLPEIITTIDPGFSLIKVEEQLAIKEVAECYVTKNIKTSDKSEVKSIENELNEEFSVDNTQNPFSH